MQPTKQQRHAHEAVQDMSMTYAWRSPPPQSCDSCLVCVRISWQQATAGTLSGCLRLVHAPVLQIGLARAQQQAHEAEAQVAREAAAALQGARPALARGPVSEEAAAQLLLTSQAMLQAQPDLQAAKCAHVEVTRMLLLDDLAGVQGACMMQEKLAHLCVVLCST